MTNNKYKGLNDILKQLDEKNEEGLDTKKTGKSDTKKEQQIDNTTANNNQPIKAESVQQTRDTYNEYVNKNGNIFWCYMDYTKKEQKYVLMIYKNPQGKEKIVCASIDMDDSTELVEKVIDELGWDTDLVYVLWWGEITLEDDTIELYDNDEDETFGMLSEDNKALCKNILEQYLYGYGIEKINHQTIKSIIDVFNIPLDDETKAKYILILFQNIVAKYEKWQGTPSLQEQKIHKQWRTTIKKYADDLDTQLPNNYISELEQYIEYTDNGKWILINDYNGLKDAFRPYWFAIITLYPNIISQQK